MDLEWLMNLLGPNAAQAGGIGSDTVASMNPPPTVPGLGALFNPQTGGMTGNEYGTGANIPQTGAPTLPNPQPPSRPDAGNYGGSPETNPALKPLAGGPQTQPGAGNALTNALRGVVVPKPPDAQKVSTPAAPRPTAAIKGGELLQLLELLNASSNAGAGNQALKLPSTLGGALGAR